MTRSKRVVGALVVSAAIGWVAPAYAQKKAPTLGEALHGEAKDAYERARVMFNKGDFRHALESLERAQRISPDPRLFWNIAACEKKLGHYARAIALVERYVTSSGDLLSEEEKRDAGHFLVAAKAFVGTVSVASNVDGTQVFVDDELLGTTPLPKPFVVDEGEHRVRFAAPGHRGTERVERAPAGSELRWVVQLEEEPGLHASAPSPSVPSTRVTARSRLGPVILGGTGIVMAGVGAVMVGLSLSEASKIARECGTACPPERWQPYRTQQLAGDVLLGVGGAALLGAAIWWVVLPSERHDAAWIAPTVSGIAGGGTF